MIRRVSIVALLCWASIASAADVTLGRLQDLTWSGSGTERWAVWGGSTSAPPASYWADPNTNVMVCRWSMNTNTFYRTVANYTTIKDYSPSGISTGGWSTISSNRFTYVNQFGDINHVIRQFTNQIASQEQIISYVSFSGSNFTWLCWGWRSGVDALQHYVMGIQAKLVLGVYQGKSIVYNGTQFGQGANTIPASNWVHYALVCSNGTEMLVYTNGALDITASIPRVYTDPWIMYGAPSMTAGNQQWEGMYDEITVYTTRLSQAAIQAHMANSHPTNNIITPNGVDGY